ncbi:hypothetical protein LJR074_003474 [Acidovorax sp. LjRoot74]|uniref:PBECR3 domain-containing polyvalent protein n=1 Tax=Acidovorax sp. LjRoot74 TaxID=3342337 RepID=UPI003ECCD555
MNEYDDLITQSLQPEPAQAARIGFAAAVDTNPEAYAEARRVAKRTGVPVDTAFNLPQEMKRQDRMGSMDFDRLAAMSPATAAILADVDQAKIAHDNVDSFSGIEGVLTALGGAAKYAVSAPGAARGGFASDVGRAGSAGLSGLQRASAGVVGLAQAPFDMAAPLADPLVGRVLPGNPLRATAEGLARYRQSIEAQAKASMPRAEGLVESGVFSGFASLASNMAALPLAFLPGGQPAAMAAMTAPVGGQAYGEARDKGVGVVPSLTFGASQAAIEYATEKLPVSRLLGDVRAGSSLLKTLGHQSALEVPGEQIATVLQDLNEWAVLHPEKPFSSYLEERPSAAAQTLIATLVGVGGNVAVMRGIDSVITGDEEKARRAQASEQQAQLLQQLTDLAKADKVLARDPETFEQFVASAAEGGPATQVFIDAQTLMQSGMAEQLAAVSPAVAAQLPQALQVGGQIAIPVQEYASRIAGSEYAQSLVDHIKTDPEGFSRAEAQHFMDTRADELKAQVEQALQQQEGDSTFKQSADAVRANVKTQLDTAGRFTPQANDAYAAMVGSFYAVQSAKLGMTPEALFERYPLRVVAESVVDGQQFDQALAAHPPKGWAHSTTGQDAAKLWGAPKGDTNAVFWTDLGGKLAQDAPELAGYSHSVDRSRVDHIRKNHGNEAAEASRGQVAVTGADVARIPEIVTGYDAIDANVSVPAEVGPEKVRGVVFAKQYEDGTVVYTGLVSSKRQNVRGATLWKYPPSVDAQTAVKRAVAKLTSETYGGMDGIVGPAGETLNQAARGSFNPATNTIALLKAADLSTFLHETGHFFLEVQMDMASRLQHEADAFGDDTNQPDEAQILADARAVLDWFGIQSLAEWHNLDFEERRAHHEQFARGFEAYLFEGKAPSIELQGLFQRFRAWLVAVYKNFKALNVELTPEVRSVFDRMLATSEEIALAEQGRSMMPLFATPDQAGMTPEAFAAYQALGLDATNTATEELQARGLRDMQWLHNARGRMLKRLQREAKDLRAEAQIDARREVMRQPVYQAWQLLSGRISRDDMLPADAARAAYREALAEWNAQRKTAETDAIEQAQAMVWQQSDEGQIKYRKADSAAKAQAKVLKRETAAIDAATRAALQKWEQQNPAPLDPDYRPKSDPNRIDPSMDSLLVAIAKLGGLSRESAANHLGVHPDDFKAQSGVFGKPVFRKTGGMTADSMAEALTEYGYLPRDEHGKHDLHDLEDKIASEIGGSPQYSAAFDYSAQFEPEAPGFANPAALSAARLDLAALSGLGVPAEVVALLKERKMTAPDGLHPDVAAELILTAEGQAAFTSGDEMVRALAEAVPPSEAIENLTDLLMLERHGDLATPEAIERAADQAIHNDVRARLLATEANALAKATGESRVLSDAAKTFAADMIARLQVRAVRTGQYAGAEVRAAKAAERAAKAGDLAQAAAEKRNQLIQHHATRAAHNALDEIDRGLRYLKKFDGDIKSLDADYAEQIANLLERFDLRKGQSLKAVDKRTALAQWLATQREAGLEPDIPAQLENEAYRTSYKNLTVEEFRGLVDTIRQIEHLGRLKNKLLTAADQRSYQAARDEIAAGIAEHAQGRQADTRTPTTNAGRAVQGLKRFWAAHIKVATWARVMDGGKDGGPVWEYFLRSANERGDMETTMRAEATARLAEIMAPVFALGKMGGKGQYFPSIRRSLNRESRIAIALNMGNEGNIQRLLGGEGWTRAQIGPVLQSLTAQEWQTVQAVWDHFESYRPQIAAKELRVYGKEPAWVEPSPLAITTQDGQTLTLRGGYYPIKYDPAASQRAEQHADAEGAKRQMQGAYTTATTRRSFTKSRVEEVSGRPLLYTLSGMYGGVNDVIHDLAWHEWLIDANRLLRSNTIDTVIREHYGPEVKQQFKSWVQDVAEGEKGSDAAVDQALSRLRQGVSAAGLGFNVVSALIQPLGLTQSITRVGVGWIGRGVARYIAHPRDLARDINGRSAFMENRARTRFRELNELRNQVQDQSAFNEYVGRYAYFLMMRCQQVVDLPTWWGAYEKATAEGNDENRAVALADQAVIDAQGGGQTKDLSAMERGGPAQRLFTVYYSFMNTALNLGVAQTMTADTAAKKGKLAVDYAMLYVVPAVLGYFLKNALTPGDSGDDDWEKIAKKLLANQIDYLMGLMVVVREFGEAAKTVSGANDMGRDYTGPAGLRLVSDTGTLAKQVHQGEFDTAFRKAAINVVGDLFGLPSAQANRTITGVNALAEGKTENPAAVVFGFQEKR